jgi:tetratricopeptide (TPR) repeat protein
LPTAFENEPPKTKEERLIETKLNRAEAAIDKEDYEQAEQIYIDISKMELSDKQKITLFDGMGDLYCHYWDYKKALEYYKKALLLKEKLFGKADIMVADSYIIIGKICYYDNYNKSVTEKYFDDALDIYITVFEEDSLEVADLYYKIGNVYFDLGKYDKVLAYYEKAVKIREKVLGKKHEDTKQTYTTIADIYAVLGNKEKANVYYQKAEW